VNTKKHGAYSRDDIGCDNRTLICHLISSYEKLLISNLHLQRKVTVLSGRVRKLEQHVGKLKKSSKRMPVSLEQTAGAVESILCKRLEANMGDSDY
jgi:hypothetical protein